MIPKIEDVGAFLRDYRVKHNMTLAELSDKTGITLTTLSYLENHKWDHKMSVQTRHKLNKAFEGEAVF